MTYYDEIAKTYNELHKEEQMKKLKIILDEDLISSSDKLLDVGCGTGFSLDYFDVIESVGIDPAEKLIEQYAGKNKALVGCAENLPFENDFFDVVISITAIQNFEDIQKGLKEIKRVGKNKFGLTFLKRSIKSQLIEKLIRKTFSEFEIKIIEEDKDLIFIIIK